MKFFEVDHPATQAAKRARLAGAAIRVPDDVVFVPVDFANASSSRLPTGVAFGPPVYGSVPIGWPRASRHCAWPR